MFKMKKSLITLVSVLAILCVTVGGTLAFLVATAPSVTNTFTLAKVTTEVVEDLNDDVKENVRIKNTGDTDAYIRAVVAVTWQDKNGNVYGEVPVAGVDYEIRYDLAHGWSKGSDGFYYWKGIVKSDDDAPDDCCTGVLITTCKPLKPCENAEYKLAVEIIGSGIQADGMIGNIPAVQDAWGMAAAKAVGAIQ